MKQLPPDTVRLLSSSQIITCVVNVVKELIENSLDAGASSIDIKLENYGLDRIEVRDNGQGIEASDTAVMAVSHYTSKISCHDDLEQLETYGFRGEALGSICAVAEVSVTTKTEDDDISTQYTLDVTGKVVSRKPSHLGQGTTVTVLKLFKNLPVRRQYYANAKKCKEELKKVQDILTAFAIVKPDLRLTLAHNKVVLWQKAKVTDHRSALLATLGSGTVANLLPCHHHREQPEISLDGFFPKPGAEYCSTSSTGHDKTFLFVNQRPVHQKEIIKLLRQHYSAQYPAETTRNRYPILMLRITVPASSVDVNLTPDKTQVLLHNKEAVLTAVEALLMSLYGYRPTEPTPAGEQPHLATSPPPASPPRTEAQAAQGGSSSGRGDPHTEPPRGDVLRTSLEQHAANSSSSSSVADDWIVNQYPGGLDCHLSLFEDDTALSGPGPPDAGVTSERPEIPLGSAALSEGKGGLSAEDWSRGTALMDPVSGEPLQPVAVHRPPGQSKLNSPEVKGQRSPDKQPHNIIAGKRASLAAYDLISSRALRAPPTPAALFEKETRADVLRENPAAGLQDISAAIHHRWKNLGEKERSKFEEKARRHQEVHERTKLASSTAGSPQSLPQGLKRKSPLSNQQLLDQLFSAQPQKKMKPPEAKPSRPLPFSVATLRRRLHRLASQSIPACPAPRGLRLVNRLASQSAWVVSCGRELMLLNPFRVEEVLLFKRLLENSILPAVTLQNPIQLTDGTLGGAEYTQALCNMEQGSPAPHGAVLISDSRLVANGFSIRFTPGLPSAERHLVMTAMADCVPFLSVGDLREILSAVVHKKAMTVQDCRPLKVTNYLQGEAVRLARQLPTSLSRKDVEETLLRMERQLGESSQVCLHGRPFLHELTDIPVTEQEAVALLRPLGL